MIYGEIMESYGEYGEYGEYGYNPPLLSFLLLLY